MSETLYHEPERRASHANPHRTEQANPCGVGTSACGMVVHVSERLHPIKLEIYRNLYTSIAKEMGTNLRRTAYSPNIKERRDYSCALFDGLGEVVAMGDHMPVHLGSMPLSVRAAIQASPLRPGDIVFLNDPYSGGNHLPDVTLIAPVYSPSHPSQPFFYVCLSCPSLGCGRSQSWLNALEYRYFPGGDSGASLEAVRRWETEPEFAAPAAA